jgi:response regulator RpfG family c-di-GMP phosphodiesterase
LLLVDDEPSVLSALRRLFRTSGYRVLQATSGKEALLLLGGEQIDLVISDMRMPEMDGAEFLAEVRHRRPATIRILLTGYADIQSTIAAINGGEIHRYVTKPWDDQDLLLLVRDALERKALETENRQLLLVTQRQNQELQQLNQTLEDRVQARVAEIKQVADMLDASYDELSQTFTVAMTVFSGLMEMRQSGIAGHSRRVADLARSVALQLGLGENDQNEIHVAALLHDIGKLGFPDSMLGKPTSMYTPDEMARYRLHPEAGEGSLMPLPRLHGAALIIRQHHERPDGFGFPDGLIGHQIHIGARIVNAVSDYDGLVNGGAAQQKYAMQEALDLMHPLAGKHYDKQVLAALECVVKQLELPPVNEMEIGPPDLKPGMKLARDLLSPKGSLLLPKGLVFNAKLIAQVQKFTSGAATQLLLHIVKDRVAPPKAPPPAAPAPVPDEKSKPAAVQHA